MSTARNRHIHLLIVDDHPVFRHGLKALLATEPDLVVVGEAHEGPAAVAAARRLKPDLILLDLALPGMHGLEVLRELAELPLRSRVVILTVGIETPQMIEALRLGAAGIVLKDAALEVIVQCIRTVMSGGYWVGREAVDVGEVLERLAGGPADPLARYRLTPREREVLEAILQGRSNRQIAEQYAISEVTVKHHLSRIYAKLGVTNRLELALFALRHRLMPKRLPGG